FVRITVVNLLRIDWSVSSGLGWSISTDSPIRSEADAIRNKIRGVGNEVSSEEFVVESKRKEKSVNSPDENTTPQTKEIVVNGEIVIQRYEDSRMGNGYQPVWFVKCGHCGQDTGLHMNGNLGNPTHGHVGGVNPLDYNRRKECDRCGATNIFNAGRTHWTYTKFGVTYSG
ncbi:MAG: hypothetical protein KF775_19080, partial [Cyclobacteriaceae bacterium]|nr:hypothetical protein [Cyclobacteriaceae bacterium]